MADPRFFHKAQSLTLERVLQLSGVVLAPDWQAEHARVLNDVAPLDRATPSDISFLDNVKYIDTFAGSKAGACFVRSKYADRAPEGMLALVTEDPYRCYALVAQQFYPAYLATGHVSPKANIDPSAKLAPGCTVEAGAFIGANAEIAEGCHISANAVIHAGVIIGAGTHIGANSTLSHCIIGAGVIIHRGVHIGQDGFGFALGREKHVKVPQLGRVFVEDDVEIGSGTCIDRGTGPDTTIGRGTKIDNLVQIGHNVHIGRQSIIVAQAGIAGSARIGDGVLIGGQCGIAGHLKIGHGVRIAAQSGVITDVPPGASYGGSPAVPAKEWHRQTVTIANAAKRKGTENE